MFTLSCKWLESIKESSAFWENIAYLFVLQCLNSVPTSRDLASQNKQKHTKKKSHKKSHKLNAIFLMR